MSERGGGTVSGRNEGRGVGDRFLGHVERCRVLLHLVDGTAEDVQANYRVIRGELRAYGQGLAEKPEIVALNKIDALDPDTIKEKQTKLRRSAKKPVYLLSGVSGQGRDDVLKALLAVIREAREADRSAEEAA